MPLPSNATDLTDLSDLASTIDGSSALYAEADDRMREELLRDICENGDPDNLRETTESFRVLFLQRLRASQGQTAPYLKKLRSRRRSMRRDFVPYITSKQS